MSDYGIFSLVLAGFIIFLISISNINRAIFLLITFIIFGGIVGIHLGNPGNIVIFRDIAIIFPIYIGIFFGGSGLKAISDIPSGILGALVFLISIVILSLPNTQGSLFASFISLKVWLYYIPMLPVGIVIAQRPKLLHYLLRSILLLGMLASAVGLTQSLLVRFEGYAPVMEAFFGRVGARMVTQNYTMFDEAGGVYRIPGTFSFVAQYSAFLYALLTVSMIEINTDPNPKIRQFARIGVFLAIIAGIFCGARSAIIVVPSLLVFFMACRLLKIRLLLLAPVGIALTAIIASNSGFNIIEYFFYGQSVAVMYGNTFILQEIGDALNAGLLGRGLGASTSAARYAGSILGAQRGYEPYLAKATAEMGYFGLVSAAFLFAVVALRGWRLLRSSASHTYYPIVAPLVGYLALNIVLSLKSSVLDTDPGNMFFWLFLGIALGAHKYGQALTRQPEYHSPATMAHGVA